MFTLRIYSVTGCLVEILDFNNLEDAETCANAFETLTAYSVERDYDDQKPLG